MWNEEDDQAAPAVPEIPAQALDVNNAILESWAPTEASGEKPEARPQIYSTNEGFPVISTIWEAYLKSLWSKDEPFPLDSARFPKP